MAEDTDANEELPEELQHVEGLDGVVTKRRVKPDWNEAQQFITSNKPRERPKNHADMETQEREIKQDQFLTVILQGTNYRDAAAIVGIDQATAKRWMYSKTLRKRFQACRDALIDSQLTRVCGSVSRAIGTLEQALTEADEWRDRISAAKELISTLQKFHSIAGIDNRLRELEQTLSQVAQTQVLPITSPVEDIRVPAAQRIIALSAEVDLTLPEDAGESGG